VARRQAVAESGRTRVLSPFEMVVVLLHCPAFHQAAAAIPYKKDDDCGGGHRNRDYPKAIVLLFGVLSRICRSQPKAEVLLRPPDQWELIRKHWNIACASGVVPEDDQKQLPTKPIRVGQWRYAQDLLTADPDAFERFEQTFIESSVELAVALGYFDQGSITNPAKSSCLFADGTEVRSQCRSYVELRVDPVTGTSRLAAIDPVAKDRVRAWLDDSTGRWRAIDPVTGVIMRKLPVDPDALASAKYGPTQSAYNVVPLSVRSDEHNSRVTLWVGIDETENAEAATILRGVDRIHRSDLRGSVQCLITDMIIRGAHMVDLFRCYGIIPVTKVAANGKTARGADENSDDDAVDDAGMRDVVLAASQKKGKRVKSLPLPPVSHEVRGGKQCRHQLMLVDGAVVEVDFDESGTNLVEISRPRMLQVKRARRSDLERSFHFTSGYEISCGGGDFTTWLCPHKELADDDGRKMAENFRIFPEGSEQYGRLYGAGRNSSEGGNAHHKDTYPHKRSQSSGRRPVHLDMYLYFLGENCRTWYFQGGFVTVDPVLYAKAIAADLPAAAG
jgi:hypothetical protein